MTGHYGGFTNHRRLVAWTVAPQCCGSLLLNLPYLTLLARKILWWFLDICKVCAPLVYYYIVSNDSAAADTMTMTAMTTLHLKLVH